MEISVQVTEVGNSTLDLEEHAKHGKLMLHTLEKESTSQIQTLNLFRISADTQKLILKLSGAIPLIQQRDGNTVIQLERKLVENKFNYNCTKLPKVQLMETNTKLRGLLTVKDSPILTKVLVNGGKHNSKVETEKF